MKGWLLLVLASAVAAAQQQEQLDQMRKMVESDYYALPYAFDLGTLREAAKKEALDNNDVQKQLDASRLTINLSDMRIGLVSEILDKKWSDQTTVPEKNELVLVVDGNFKA